MNRFADTEDNNEGCFDLLGHIFLDLSDKEISFNFDQSLDPIKNQIKKNQIKEFGTLLAFNGIQKKVYEFLKEKKLYLKSLGEEVILSDSHLCILLLFTMNSPYYSNLNKRLQLKDRAPMLPFKLSVWLLLDALKMCPTFLPQSGHLYRGIKHVNLSGRYDIGVEIEWHQFSSCSTSLEVALSFMVEDPMPEFRTLFIITILSGLQSTCRARCITKYSCYPKEEEVLLPLNTRFVVTGKSAAGGGLTYIHMTEMYPLDPITEFRPRDLLDVR